MSRRRFLLLLVATGTFLASQTGRAEPAGPSFPAQPIRWVVPFPPSGSIDSVARIVSQKLGQILGQPIIVENRAGAGGRVGAKVVADAKPDGYTQLFTLNTTYTIDRSLYRSLPYDPDAFEPVTIIATSSQLLLAGPKVPVKSVQDLVALAKAHPHELTYASSGVGGSLHLAMLYFTTKTGIDLLHVPYKGGPPAVTDVMAGRVSVMFFNTPAALPYVKNGLIRPLGVSTAKRSPVMPDVPTIAESGVPGFDLSVWFGLSVPHGTPKAVVERMYAAVREALQDPQVRAQLEALDAQPLGDSPDAFAARIRTEGAAWSQVFAQTKMKLE